MNCDCGCYQFDIIYKHYGPRQELDGFRCEGCGNVYLWSGSHLNKQRGIKSFSRRGSDDS